MCFGEFGFCLVVTRFGGIPKRLQPLVDFRRTQEHPLGHCFPFSRDFLENCKIIDWRCFWVRPQSSNECWGYCSHRPVHPVYLENDHILELLFFIPKSSTTKEIRSLETDLVTVVKCCCGFNTGGSWEDAWGAPALQTNISSISTGVGGGGVIRQNMVLTP